MSVAIKQNSYPPSVNDWNALEGLSDAVVSVNKDGSVLWMNALATKIFGSIHSCSELSWKNVGLSGQDKKRVKPFHIEMIKDAGVYEDVVVCSDYEARSKIFELKTHFYQNKTNAQPTVILFFRDTTQKKEVEKELLQKHIELNRLLLENQKQNMELKATQELLVQAGKLASLGELSAGIAHELNQPLQILKGYAQELDARFSKKINSTEFSEYLNEIIQSVNKMSDIIQALRAFAVKSTDQFTHVDVTKIIEDVILISSKNLTQNQIQLEFTHNQKCPAVYANETQLRQVVMNLISNAKDALLDEKTKKDKKIHIELTPCNEVLELSVSDNGIGMTEETRNKIFNPFFTTKEVGKGMGIGLNLSFGILKEICGTMTVESQFKKGTKFLVRLPFDFRTVRKINKGEGL